MKKNKLPAPVYLIILSLVTVIVWTTFEFIRTFTKVPEPEVAPEIIEALNPNLDEQTLNQLNQKIMLSEDQIGELPTTQKSITNDQNLLLQELLQINTSKETEPSSSPSPSTSPIPITNESN